MDKKCWNNPQREEVLKYCLPLVKDLEDSSEAELGAPAGQDTLEQVSQGSPMAVSSPEDMELDIPDQKNGMYDSQNTKDTKDTKEQSKLMFKTCACQSISVHITKLELSFHVNCSFHGITLIL